jgi:hypothetical protein
VLPEASVQLTAGIHIISPDMTHLHAHAILIAIAAAAATTSIKTPKPKSDRRCY